MTRWRTTHCRDTFQPTILNMAVEAGLKLFPAPFPAFIPSKIKGSRSNAATRGVSHDRGEVGTFSTVPCINCLDIVRYHTNFYNNSLERFQLTWCWLEITLEKIRLVRKVMFCAKCVKWSNLKRPDCWIDQKTICQSIRTKSKINQVR